DKVARSLDIYRFDEAANGLYHFAWSVFCDWYLEFAKPLLQGSDEAAKAETQATAAWVLNKLMHLLHPLMPYITEEIWQSFNGAEKLLMKESWPKLSAGDTRSMDEMRWVINVISLIRSVRSELNVPAGVNIPLIARGCGEEEKKRLEAYRNFIFRLARLSELKYDQPAPKGSAQAVLGKVTFIMPLADIIDLDAERARLEKERGKIAEEINKLSQKLANPQFTDKAPAEVVEEHQQRLEAARTTLAGLDAAQAKLTA
ncbi:MAG TPA: class I tRNA ligase family protein, partial [Alphaproteobacteria bacterium]|nr:class I tRNA ligase family protein [Alphaproteobacteria bacterium]